MNKTKTARATFLPRLLLAFIALLVLITPVVAMFPQTAAAKPASASEAKKRAEAFCKSKKYSNNPPGEGLVSDFKACTTGYESSIQGKLVSAQEICVGDNAASDGRPVAGLFACLTGFNQGFDEFIKDNPPKISAKEAASRAKAYCDTRSYTGVDLAACQVGYKATIQGKSNWKTVCNGFNGNSDVVACAVGQTQGIKEYQKDHGGKEPSGTTKPIETAPEGGTVGTAGGSGADTATANNDRDLDCDMKATNPLSWIVCPVVDMLVSAITVTDRIITNQMTIETDKIFCDSDDVCEAYYKAWQSFRNIALGLLALIGLTILISQALGWELLDAYMVKKTLPRLLAAALGITLSWPLMEFFVILSNDLGMGIRHLMYAPFAGLSDTINLDFGGNFIENFFFGTAALTGGAATVGIGAFVVAGGLGVLLSYAATAGLAVLVAILVLILREVAIIMLMLMAPIAIVMYILPNTQKFYKFWWESFSKALLMFPLIAAFITAGRIFSAIAISSGGFLNQLIAFVAYFAPYFLIPLTFKFAGGALRTLGGFVNDRSRGGFDILGNYRKGQAKQRLARARAGKFAKEDWGSMGGRLGVDRHGRPRTLGRYLNRSALWATDFDEKIPEVIGNRGGRLGAALFGNYAQYAGEQIDNETMAHIHKAAQTLTQNGPLHHKAERALAGVYEGYSAPLMNALHDEGFVDGEGRSIRAPQGRADINRIAELMREHGDTDEVSAASDLHHVAGVVGNLHQDPEMFRAANNVQGLGALLLAGSGRLETHEQAQILNQVSANPRQGAGLAARLEKQTSAVGSRQRAELRHGKGLTQDADGVYHDAFEDPTSARAIDNVTSMKQQELAASKGETIDKIEATWAHLLGTGPANGYAADADGNLTIPRWSNDQETVRQQIFQAASQYSGTDPAFKERILDFMDNMSLGASVPLVPGAPATWDMRSEFDQRESRGFDPRFAGTPAGGPGATPTPGGGTTGGAAGGGGATGP